MMDMMVQKEECKSIPSKKNMMDNKKKTWEFDEAREPLILISTTNIHHMGLSYPPRCPITNQRRSSTTKAPEGWTGTTRVRIPRTTTGDWASGGEEEPKSLVGTAADILRGVLIRNHPWSKENGSCTATNAQDHCGIGTTTQKVEPGGCTSDPGAYRSRRQIGEF